MKTSTMPKNIGDTNYQRRQARSRRRAVLVQTVVLAVCVLILVGIGINVHENLEANNIRSGFGFLLGRAGFDIGEKSIPFTADQSFIAALFTGFVNTARVAFFGIISATLMGVVVGMMRLSRHPALRFMGTAHVEFYRNIPLLVLLLAIYLSVTELLPRSNHAFNLGDWLFLSKAGIQYASPLVGWWAVVVGLVGGAVVAGLAYWRLKRVFVSQIAWLLSIAVFAVGFLVLWVGMGAAFGWDHPHASRFSLTGGSQLTPEFLSLWLGLMLFTSASIAEIVRAGVVSVPAGQWDAALALGLTRFETVSYVIFPQSMRLVVPPLASQFMNLTKNSSLAVMVGYPDLVSVANTTLNVSAQAIEVILIIMVVYLVINLFTSLVMNQVNRRVTRSPL